MSPRLFLTVGVVWALLAVLFGLGYALIREWEKRKWPRS